MRARPASRADGAADDELAPFDDDPADPVPFGELARTRPDFVQQVLDEANAALEASAPTDCA